MGKEWGVAYFGKRLCVSLRPLRLCGYIALLHINRRDAETQRYAEGCRDTLS
jgi:hypothetical protein